VICVADDGYDDLQAWKVYETLPDEKAPAAGCIRVVDDSGEDYLYPANRFSRVDIPKDVKARLPKAQTAIKPRGEPVKVRSANVRQTSGRAGKGPKRRAHQRQVI
jgi:hypothetical protein